MAQLATETTETTEMPDTTGTAALPKSIYGPFYDHAFRVARQHGFFTVTQAHEAMAANPKAFTRKERRSLVLGRRQFMAHQEDAEDREGGLMDANSTATSTQQTLAVAPTQTNAVTTLTTGTTVTTTYGKKWTYEQRDPFKETRNGIKAYLAIYRQRRALGRPVGVHTHVDREIHTAAADSATWDLWVAARSLGADLNIFADAFALDSDGTASVRIDDGLQAEAADEVAIVREALGAIRASILRMDEIIAAAKRARAGTPEGGNDGITAAAAD